VCEKSTLLSVYPAKGAVSVYNIKLELSVFLNYTSIPSFISPDNREHTVYSKSTRAQRIRAVPVAWEVDVETNSFSP
jgi:hypothetical protein